MRCPRQPSALVIAMNVSLGHQTIFHSSFHFANKLLHSLLKSFNLKVNATVALNATGKLKK